MSQKQPVTIKRIKQKELAELWGITPARVSALVKAGCPLTSVEDAERWRSDNMTRSKPDPGAATLTDAKLVILRLDAQKREIQIKRLLGEQVDAKQTLLIWGSILNNIKNYIVNCEGITREQASNITSNIDKEISNLQTQIMTAAFKEAELDEEEETE